MATCLDIHPVLSTLAQVGHSSQAQCLQPATHVSLMVQLGLAAEQQFCRLLLRQRIFPQRLFLHLEALFTPLGSKSQSTSLMGLASLSQPTQTASFKQSTSPPARWQALHPLMLHLSVHQHQLTAQQALLSATKSLSAWASVQISTKAMQVFTLTPARQ